MPNNQKNNQTSVENKLTAVLRVINDEESEASVAADLGLHRDTVNRWIRAYKKKGREGLENPGTKSHSSDSPLTENQKRIKELEKQIKEQEENIEILQKFQDFLKTKK
ncbi:transposase [Falsibacillus pallidus]|uniref:transposase n=1 Tax=Falsibacillus pallidus TaxID=493781 RepID=UPI003D96C042